MKSLMEIMNKDYDLFCFDLDGTIIDSTGLMRNAWREVNKKFNLGIDFSHYLKFVGLPFPDILDNLNIKDHEEIMQTFFEYTSRNSDQIKLHQGVLEFIHYLKKNNKKVFIITSKIRKNSEQIINKFSIPCDGLFCGDDPIPHKPSGKLIKYILNEFNFSNRDKVIYFGDMLVDVLFSINCSIDYCHCDFGIDGALPKELIVKYKSIASWGDIY